MKYNFYRDVIVADAAEMLCSSTTDFIRFSCSDPHLVFDVDCELFTSSRVIKTILKNINEEKLFGSKNTGHKMNQEPLVVPFSSYNFQRCLDFIIHSENIEPPMTGEDLVHTMKIADFLDMQPLKEAAIIEMEKIMDIPCLKTIRKQLCIKNDFSKRILHQMVLEGLDKPDECDGKHKNQRLELKGHK